MNNINLPPDVEFHEDIRLVIYRPLGLLNAASIDKVLRVLEDLETQLQEPFNRFSDASAIDRVELNYQYVIQGFSSSRYLLRRSSTREIRDSDDGLHNRPLFPVACHNHSGLAH